GSGVRGRKSGGEPAALADGRVKTQQLTQPIRPLLLISISLRTVWRNTAGIRRCECWRPNPYARHTTELSRAVLRQNGSRVASRDRARFLSSPWRSGDRGRGGP